MKAMVTGGAGFIGSHLVERLVAEGHQVVAVDDLSGGSLENLEALLGRYGFLLRVVDLLDREALDDAFAGVDWVFHLAGRGDALSSLRDPAGSMRSHLEATLQVLEAARRVRVKKLVYAASAEAYEDVAGRVTETCRLAPGSPHAFSKAMGEDLTLSWARIHGLPTLSLRLFNVYGPRAPLTSTLGSAPAVMAAQRAAGAPLTVAGDGVATRDLIHVSDVTAAFLRAAESDVCGEAINVGSGIAASVADLAHRIGGPTRAVATRPGDRLRQCADISRAQRLLGWTPTMDLARGVDDLLKGTIPDEDRPVWTAETHESLHASLLDARGCARRQIVRAAAWSHHEDAPSPPVASFPLPF